jgi:hypothetical protein
MLDFTMRELEEVLVDLTEPSKESKVFLPNAWDFEPNSPEEVLQEALSLYWLVKTGVMTLSATEEGK